MVTAAVRLVDRAFLVDNSYLLDRALRDIVVFERGQLTYVVETHRNGRDGLFPRSHWGSNDGRAVGDQTRRLKSQPRRLRSKSGAMPSNFP